MRIDFQGYAGDCMVAGQIDTDGLRLSDTLEQADELVIHEATRHSLASGQETYAGELVMLRDDLFAVATDGPAGSAQRRVRTVRHALRIELGPYTVFGELHTLPGADPLRTLLVRRTMVPLTNCLIHFRRGGLDEFRRAPLLIVNGALIRRVELATTDQLDSELAALGSDPNQDQPAQTF